MASLQSCATLCDPIDGSPLGSPVPGILQARTLEWGAIAFSVMKIKVAINQMNFPGGAVVKNLTAMQETWVRSLGREVASEKEMATHSSILAWKIPWTEEPSRLQSMGSLRVGHD